MRRAVTWGLLALCAGPALAQEAAQPLPFTKAQAERGKALFEANCAQCHGADLNGSPGGPPLTGFAFRGRWQPQKGDALLAFMQAKMPPGNPGQLSTQNYADVLAHVLAGNGGKPGAAELPADVKRLAPLSLAATLPPLPATADVPRTAQGPTDPSLKPDATALAAMERQKQRMAKLKPVTDEMLRNPAAGDWLNWRHSQQSTGFSPLTQITRDNVAGLKAEWSWSLQSGINEITPLVHDGVLFVLSAGRLQALDAASGDLLWQYARPGVTGPVRGLAIAGENIYLATADVVITALDMRTGAVVWERAVAEPSSKLKFSAAPLIAGGKVIQGVSGCSGPYPGGCFIVALDAATGEEAWRFYTIARPGQLGGDSWNGAPVDQRFGGSVWVTGSYDPDLDLVYFGTGQTYKTATLLQGGPTGENAKPGYNDGLFTDTTLALRPATGELVWHYQHMKREVWDLDWSFERILTTLPIDGKPTKVVIASSKTGLFDTLDATTGRYLFSLDAGVQNLVESIDPKTGDKKIAAKFAPQPNVEMLICPSALGGRDWPATAFNPATRILYVPLNEACMNFKWQPGPGNSFDIALPTRPRPDSDGMVGRVQAIDLQTRKTLWTQRRRAPESSAILATAGGLIFEGSRDRWFRASDDRTGKVLWQQRLDGVPSSYPISYSVDGVQYIAVTAGGGNAVDGGMATLTPEIAAPGAGTTLWIFRLPDAKGKQVSQRAE